MKSMRYTAAAMAFLFALLLAPTPIAFATPGDWWADYFPNPNLEGTPVLSRPDAAIDFDWGGGSPDPAIPADGFSVRWTREEWFGGGTYRFLARTDDGVRIWVGGELVLDEWHDRQADWVTADRYIPAGVTTVVVEYYEHGGGAIAYVSWERLTGGATWRAAYFDNKELSGDPVLLRDDPAIDFDWSTASPDPAVPADNFSVRWTRTLGFTAGTYRFLASCDDGVHIYVDGQTVVSAWQTQQLPNTHSGEVQLDEGQHTIVVTYFEQGGEASAHVWWERRDAVSGWEGLYYDNPDLVGGPALVRDDAEINFDWGGGPPVDWMPDDNFSVQWSRTVDFAPGYYIFKVQADDGMQFWLDGELLMDKWHLMQGELHYRDGVYLEGLHQLVVKYFEQNGGARIHFWWEASTADGVMPRYDDPTMDPWHAEFFTNPNLEGAPALRRIDPALDYDWGLSAPAWAIPADNFSARWTQTLLFDAGVYRFTAAADDGIRLWVDGRLLIDAWQATPGTHSAATWLAAGGHRLQVEYFDQSGNAMAHLTWERVQANTAQPAQPVGSSSATIRSDLEQYPTAPPGWPRGIMLY